jgi:hypothetical protein
LARHGWKAAIRRFNNSWPSSSVFLLDRSSSACNHSEMFWVALAAQLAAPVPVDIRHWWEGQILRPAYAAGINHVMLTRTTVRPDSSVRSCDVEHGSGSRELDSFTCSVILKHGKFRAARAIDGSTAYGVFRLAFTWANDVDYDDPRGDLEVTVNQLPPKLHSPVTVLVAFAVDEHGQASSCTGEVRPGIRKRALQLAGFACDELLKNYKPVPVKDDSGRFVPSIQDASVQFVTPKQR